MASRIQPAANSRFVQGEENHTFEPCSIYRMFSLERIGWTNAKTQIMMAWRRAQQGKSFAPSLISALGSDG